jgi:tRNA dimethylallyltransferase
LKTAHHYTEKPLVVVVAGPTASGKSAVAIKLAQYFNTEVLSADSRQCYQELNIGVARPTIGELRTVPHHFIASHSIHETVDAAVFENYGLEKLQGIFLKSKIAIVVGGTGLYIKALCEGLDNMPDIPAACREIVRTLYIEQGLEAIQRELASIDPEYFAHGEINNPHRCMRALEVSIATGKSILSFQKGTKKNRPFEVCFLGMQVEKVKLHDQINHRVEIMMENGLFMETKALYPFRKLIPLQTVGYQELFEHFEGKLSLKEAVEQIKTHTRQYAKRQMTWFKKQEGIQWIPPNDIENMIDLIQKHQSIKKGSTI